METTFGDNVWSELVGEITSSSAYSSVAITKTISLKISLLYFDHPNNRSFHDPEISVNKNEYISAVLSCSIFHIGS